MITKITIKQTKIIKNNFSFSNESVFDDVSGEVGAFFGESVGHFKAHLLELG